MKPREIFLREVDLLENPRRPVWFMRQAGRYQREYLEIKEKYSIVDISNSDELIVRVSILPLKLGVDAIIIFSDILLPLFWCGFEVRYGENGVYVEGNIDKIFNLEINDNFLPTLKALKILRRDFGDYAIIGFVGGPFTLMSYILGDDTSNNVKTKEFMYSNQKKWESIMERFVSFISEYILEQVKWGCDIVQIFDSWIGSLSPSDFSEFIKPYLYEISKVGVKKIYFSTKTAGILHLMKDLNFEVFSVDWRIDILSAHEIFEGKKAIQGNLDPSLLLAPRELLMRRILDMKEKMRYKRGFIFNLGHGILPQTREENVKFAIDIIKS